MRDRARAKRLQRQRRHHRIRKQIIGTPERPRLAVFRSNKHISAQIIDDTNGKTLCSVASTSLDVRKALEDAKGKVEVSRRLGRMLAEKAHEAGISKVAFDRGGFRYHGRVKALGEGARESGSLEF